MIFSETNAKIATALAKAWGKIESPKHNSTVKVKTRSGGEYTFDYTDLGGIFDAAKEVFKENEISILQNAYTTIADGQKLISVETMLLHSSGEYVKSLPLQMEANTSIQDMGGQVTYMKRYSLSAMLGIATEKDDDANGASGNAYQQTRSGSQKVSKLVNKNDLLEKWVALSGNNEGFDKFYQEQTDKGYNNNQINAFLQKQIEKKQK